MARDEINILMGSYEIFCDKEKDKWMLQDRLSGEETIYNSLGVMLDDLERQILKVEIED